MAYKVTKILEILGDGKWHELEQIRMQMGLDGVEMQEIAEFLTRYDLAKIDESYRKLRVTKDFQKILVENPVT